MSVDGPRIFRVIGCTLLACAALLLLGWGGQEYLAYREKVAKQEARALQHGQESDEKCARALETTKTLRIWAAGFRSSSGFCPPCSRFPPPTVLYETSDARDIREFGAILRFRRTPSGSEIANCGPLTFDFVSGEEILHSFNYKGSRLTDESAPRIEEWLKRREVWTRLETARKSSAMGPRK